MATGYTLPMATDPETLYRQLGRLIEAMPELNHVPPSIEDHRWLARAYALVAEVGNLADGPLLTIAINRLSSAAWQSSAEEIRAIVFRAFAVAELKAPPGAGGAFIPVGNSFDAFTALAKILAAATKDVLIIDPYMDDTALTEFAHAVPEGIPLRLMSDKATYKTNLQVAAKKWVQQYGAARPLMVRIAPPKALHDRAVFIDHTVAWTLTQSLKDFAKRSPAEMVRADDTAALKIAAYEIIWAASEIIV